MIDIHKHIGNIKLDQINFSNGTAILGILIGDMNCWGRNICTESVKLLIDYSFRILNLNKIKLGIKSENKAAIKCYKKSGLKIEQLKNDDDIIVMSIIRRECICQ